jgi:hypothetical protein
MSFVWFSEQTAIISLNGINQPILKVEMLFSLKQNMNFYIIIIIQKTHHNYKRCCPTNMNKNIPTERI